MKSKALLFLLPTFLFLLPIFFLPLTPTLVMFSKQILALYVTLIILCAWVFDIINSHKIILPKSPLVLALFFIALTLSTNLIFVKEGNIESLIAKGALILALCTLSYTILTHPAPHKLTRYSLSALSISTTLLGLYSLFQLTFLYAHGGIPTFLQSRAFSPAGSPLIALTILGIGAGISLSFTFVEKDWKKYLFFGSALIQIIAFAGYSTLMLPGGELAPLLLPYTASWAISIDALKSWRSALLGVGLVNFPALFTQVKPLYLNSGTFWNNIPQSSSSELLQILSTGGVPLFLSFLYFASLGLKKIKLTPLNVGVAITLLALILTPGNTLTYSLFFIFIALAGSVHSTTSEHPLAFPFPMLFVAILQLSLVILIGYFTTILIISEIHIYKANLAYANNDGKTVYEQNIAAITLIPRMSNYRLLYSQVNLNLAGSLSQKKDLTEDERTQITTLISQAIREGKIATELRPNISSNWQNLAVIYRSLVGVASNADQLAIEGYSKAIALDPGNATLRVEFGELLYQLSNLAKDKDQQSAYLSRAISEFQIGIQLHPSYTSAAYNLSKAFESAGNITAAYTAMQKVVANLDPVSPDFQTASTELEALKTKLPSPPPSPTSDVPTTLPSETPSPL